MTRIICGFSRQYNWTASDGTPGVFSDPDGDGLDLSGSEDGYASIIATTDDDCLQPELALHEFGHLFGAGHERAEGNLWLYDDSHAYLLYLGAYGTFRSNLYTQFNVGNATLDYSAYYTENNQHAISQTATSVANYRPLTGVPPPPQNPPPPSGGCFLTTPINVTGNLVAYCDPSPPYSHYVVSWGDLCPSQTTHYEVFASQPVGTPWTYKFQVGTPVANIQVWGADSDIKVRACNGAVCTSLSNSSYVAHSGC